MLTVADISLGTKLHMTKERKGARQTIQSSFFGHLKDAVFQHTINKRERLTNRQAISKVVMIYLFKRI